MQVTVGEYDLLGVPFPLVLADRFFHVYSSPSGYKLDVFRWDEESQQAFYDMKDSVIQVDEIGTHPTSIIDFTEPAEGTVLCKFRPQPGVSQISGKVPIKGEFEIKINYHSIVVSVAGGQIADIDKNTATGSMIGIYIKADGSFERGTDRLPDGMNLVRKKLPRTNRSYIRM